MTTHSMRSDTPEPTMADGFRASALRGALPMFVWGAHFFLSYASVEVSCALRLHRFKVLDVSALDLWLWSISAAAIATLVVLTVRAVRRHGADAESCDMHAAVPIGTAVLALVGVVWSAVPIAFVYGPAICHTAY